VYFVARAIDNVIKSGQNPLTNQTAILAALPRVSFTGLTGRVSVDAVGNRVGAYYGLYNLQPSETVPGRLNAVLVGRFRNNELEMIATPIFSDGTSNIPRDPTLPILVVPYASGAAAIAALASIGLVGLIATLIAVWVFHRNKLIHRSSPFFLQIIIVGLALALISIFFWIGTPTALECHLRVWLGFVGVALAYGYDPLHFLYIVLNVIHSRSLLAKNARLYYLFSQPSLRVRAISNKQLATYQLLCLSPLLVPPPFSLPSFLLASTNHSSFQIVLVLWSSLSPFQIEYQTTPNLREQFVICKSENDVIFASISFSYMGLLFAIGGLLSYRTRTLPDVFRESWYIAIATYNMLLLSALGIILGTLPFPSLLPIYLLIYIARETGYVLLYDVTAYTIITTGALVLGALITHALIFLPKFHALATKRTEIENWSSSKTPADTDTDTKNSIDLSSFYYSTDTPIRKVETPRSPRDRRSDEESDENDTESRDSI